MLQFSNVYTTTPSIRQFAVDPSMQVDCAGFVSSTPGTRTAPLAPSLCMHVYMDSTILNKRAGLATGDRLLRLYSGMSAGE